MIENKISIEKKFKPRYIISKKNIVGTFFIFFVGIINGLCVANEKLGAIVGVVTGTLLVFILIKKGMKHYFLSLIFFLSVSLENAVFFTGSQGGNLYNFLNLPVIGGYHIYCYIVIPLGYILYNRKLKGLYGKSNARDYIVWISFFVFTGIAMAIINIANNTNGILQSEIFLTYFRRDILRYVSMLLISLYLFYFLQNDDTFSQDLERLLFVLLVSAFPVMLTLAGSHINGYYGSYAVIPIGYYTFFGVYLVLFPFYDNQKYRYLCLMCGTGIILLTLKYPSPFGGKWWLLIMSLPVAIIYLFPSQSVKKKITILLLTIIAMIAGGTMIGYLIKLSSGQSIYKLYDALGVLKIWEEDWYYRLQNSPRYRIDEFVNVFLNIKERLSSLIFGNGFGGNIKKVIGLSDWSSITAFSAGEVSEGLYFNMHETINTILMKFGLVGIFFYFKIILRVLKKAMRSFWLIPGGVWFLFFFQSYNSLWFGLCCLILGFYQMDEENNDNR